MTTTTTNAVALHISAEQRAALAPDLQQLMDAAVAADLAEAQREDEMLSNDFKLPSVEYMRGYLARLSPSDWALDETPSLWLTAMLDEVEALRDAMLEMRPMSGRNEMKLTDREVEIYRLLRNTNMTVTEISQRLYVSTNTIKTHCKNVFRKAGVTRRAQLRDRPAI